MGTKERAVLSLLNQFRDEYGGRDEELNEVRHAGNRGLMMPMRYDTNAQLADALAFRTAQGGDIRPEDIEFLRQSEAEDAEYAFDRWYAGQWDLTRLSHILAAQKTGESFFGRAEDRLEANLELAKRLAKIEMFGPRSEEDWIIKFGLQTGYYKEPHPSFFLGFKSSNTEAGNGGYEPGRLRRLPPALFGTENAVRQALVDRTGRRGRPALFDPPEDAVAGPAAGAGLPVAAPGT